MLYLINDHKCGFNLTNKIVEIANKIQYTKLHEHINYECFLDNHNYFDKSYKIRYLVRKLLKKNPKIIPKAIYRRFCYLFWNEWHEHDKYILIIRDPREIVISGYLYHKKCNELWAINKSYSYYYFWDKYHFKKSNLIKNKKYIDFSKKISIDQNYKSQLNNLNEEDGILHELNNISFLTLSGLNNYDFYNKKNIIIIRFEDLIFNFKKTLEKILNFSEINDVNKSKIYNEVNKYNLFDNKDGIKFHENFITNYNLDLNRYKNYFTKRINNEFNNNYKGLLRLLKY